MTRSQRYYVAWPDRTHGPWMIELTFGVQAGRWELVGLRIQPRQPDLTSDDLESEDGPLTTSLLRSLPLAQLTAEWRTWRAQSNREGVDSGAVWVFDLAGDRLDSSDAIDWLDRQSGADETRGEAKAGRRVYWTAARLREVARVYAVAWDQGENPTAAVVAHFNKSPSMAAKLVSMARRRRLLPRTKKGKAGWISRPTADGLDEPAKGEAR